MTSWWQHTTERRKTMVQLVGHIDSSLVLVKVIKHELQATGSPLLSQQLLLGLHDSSLLPP